MLRRLRSGQSLSTRPTSRRSSIGVGGRPGVEQGHAVRSRPRGERLPLDPAADACRPGPSAARLVVVGGVGVGERAQRAEYGSAGPHVAGMARVACAGQDARGADECHEAGTWPDALGASRAA